VHDAEGVRLAERAEHVSHDAADADERERALLGEDVGHVLPVEVLHDEVEDPVLGPPEVDDRDARRVVEAARRAGLVVEARDRLVVREEVRVNHLHRDGAAEHRLLGAVDLAHAADADQLLQQVGAPDGAAEQRVGPGLVHARAAVHTEARPFVVRRPALRAELHAR